MDAYLKAERRDLVRGLGIGVATALAILLWAAQCFGAGSGWQRAVHCASTAQRNALGQLTAAHGLPHLLCAAGSGVNAAQPPSRVAINRTVAASCTTAR
jgi:hypothetical protein